MSDLGQIVYGGLGQSWALVHLEFGWVRFIEDNGLGKQELGLGLWQKKRMGREFFG